MSAGDSAVTLLRKRLDALSRSAAVLRSEGLPFPIDQIREVFEAAVAGELRERAQTSVKLGEALLRRADSEWGRVHNLLKRVDALRAIARTAGFSIPHFDTRLGNPRQRIMSERLSSKALERAAESASRALVDLDNAVPTFCVQEARHLGKWIQRHHDLGEDVADATRLFSRLLNALRDRDFANAVHRMVDVRREIARVSQPPTIPGREGASAKGESPRRVWPDRAFVLNDPGVDEPPAGQEWLGGGDSTPGDHSGRTAPLPPRPPRWIPFLPEATVISVATVVGLIAFHIIPPFSIFFMLWIFVAPVLTYIFVSATIGLSGLVRSPSQGVVARSKAHLSFVFAAKFCPAFVSEGVASVHAACAAVGFSSYAVYVVTEVPSEVPGARVLVVPEAYSCEAKYKARALNYALRFLPNSSDAWILHLDEDARVVPQTIGAILSFIEEKGQTHFIANGFNAGVYNRRLISFVAEAFRPISFAWHHAFMRNGRALWMYGSNLLIRSDVEQYVTWETGLYNAEMAGEDAMIGYKTYRAYGPVFAWHGGLSIERAPSTLRGTLKQRRRWFFSGLSLIMACPAQMRPIRIYAATGWAAGMFIVGFGFVREVGLLAHHNYVGVPLWFLAFGLFLFLLWLARMQVNMYLTLKHNGSHPTPLRRIEWHLAAIPLAPIAGLFIVGGPLIALLHPPKGFQITDK